MTTHTMRSLFVVAGLALVGCTDGTDSVDGEFVVEGADGKADGLNGKKLSIQVDGDLVGGFEDAGGYTGTTSIGVFGADRVLVAGEIISLSPYDDDAFGTRDWRGTGILRLAAVSRSTDADVGFVLLNPDNAIGAPRTVLRCSSTQGNANFFRTLDIDGDRKLITVNGVRTFTFAQCGFSMKTYQEWTAYNGYYATNRVQAMVVPTRWAGLGRLEAASYQYRLAVELR